MYEPIITAAGLRGIVGLALNPETAMRYAVAYSAIAPDGHFVLTRDSRPSGALFAQVLHATLNALGRHTVDAGIAATPTTGILIRQYKAAGGIQISASHNPSEFNGLKLISAEGRAISKNDADRVLELYKTVKPPWVNYQNIATHSLCPDATTAHIEAVLKTINVEAIAQRKFKVLLDSNHGAGAILGIKFLERLHCRTTILGKEPTGQFLHTPEPTPEHLADVCKIVQKGDFDVAFCQDPDADRLAIIDGDGKYIGEECTVALCADHILQSATKNLYGRMLGPIVINCATSRLCEDIAAKYGIPVYRSPVGEANVVEMMLDKHAVFGGEGNGGTVDPAVGYIRDSFAGMAQILDLMASSTKTIAQRADALPKYALIKRKWDVDLAKVPAMLDKVAAAFKHLPCDRMDGLRIDHGNAWVLLRGSNTEPIIRIFAEAPTIEQAKQLCDEIEQNVGIA